MSDREIRSFRKPVKGRPRRTALVAAGTLLVTTLVGTANATAGPAPAPSGGALPSLPLGVSDTSKLQSWAQAQLSADSLRRSISLSLTPSSSSSKATVKQAITSSGPANTLVLYDTAGPYGFLGELYAEATANLAGHFGSAATEPVSSYTAGQVDQYTATVYIGSTYYGGSIPDAIPDAFYSDAVTTTHPVIWMNDNIWNLAAKAGAQNFIAKYGWDPTTSYFSAGGVNAVTYRGKQLTRIVPAAADGGILQPTITSPSTVTTVATATSPTMSFPWAVRSGNLTYLGEIPYAYISETDRIIAFEDMLYDALAPAAAVRHRAMLRLEDISPASNPNELMAVAQYLKSQNIPYGFNVIPQYKDPLGYYNDGTPQSISLLQAPQVVNAIRYMLNNGGTIIDEGYTHQYSNVKNPYTGVTGDDFEFFRSHIDASNNVVLDGPVAEDSMSWATSRLISAKEGFLLAPLLPEPSIWVTPHYAASAIDYQAIAQNFPTRYERSLYYSGLLSGQPINSASYIGQFFPYPIHDLYGSAVLPENLGDYEPVPLNNHPVRLPADIIHEADLNLAVRDGFASFFYDPSYGTGPLQQTVSGIKGLGYTFTSPATAAQ